MGEGFFKSIQENPIIAAVNNEDNLEKAIESPSNIIFLLTGNIFNLSYMVNAIKNNDMDVYIHVDLIEGFSKDIVALDYINKNIKPDGIITTKNNLIRYAKNIGIFAIQRLFLLDSLSLETGIKSIKSMRPNAIELLPGVMPKVTKIIHEKTNVPVITGGLIMDKSDVINSLRAGAIGISTSKEDIWYM
ncbi:glycerol-3-phosphate responsive antiterminator [Clostridium sp. D2Q-14]|uniref:glycerol-3-phosphate responsive antiterminator n=1 Tax=Anaeromonas gelatinilytica TaxID=2683194 RepID=UPI00193B0466|nr:glycerol-3-phosphate responsive antiterminator [Anaeromonas gelatinilytica]MBS4534441.1 glycerol-3-phosphate responsive antiterminator [Anaeromonas gelatinilytica]